METQKKNELKTIAIVLLDEPFPQKSLSLPSHTEKSTSHRNMLPNITNAINAVVW